MAEHSGFFTAKINELGLPDRRYNAETFSDQLGAVISNGVRRSGDLELKVTAAGNMKLTINVGRGWINGKWYHNDSIFDDFTVPTAPVGDTSRIDRVILRLNKNTADTDKDRMIYLDYLQGEAAASPVAPKLIRDNNYYDLCLANIKVNSAVVQITQEDIEDTRADKELCGWITTPIGYDDFFTELDEAFNYWWKNLKDTVATTVLYKEYKDVITIPNLSRTVLFNIPQYDPSGVDIINVSVNGYEQVKDIDYTITGNNLITFTSDKNAGTRVIVTVNKSIDGTGLGSVSDEVTELQNQVAKLELLGQHVYECNGYDDNVKLSRIMQAYLAEDDGNYSQLTIKVYGNFGANAPAGGTGSMLDRYKWITVGGSVSTKKRIILDFENSSQITLRGTQDAYYTGINGATLIIKNANILLDCPNGKATMFATNSGYINADNCRLVVNASTESCIAETGTFNNCWCETVATYGNSYCFNVKDSGLLRANGGEYYAYSNSSGNIAAVIYTSNSDTNAVVITNGMNCPKVARTGLYQNNSVLCNSGYGAINDMITNLTMSKATNQNVRGVYNLEKPNKM